ncbi:short-chain dehydrogenase/reductase SDR [Rhodopseudomonas palustris BisB18]|uniref:Short-chain dehydrogenase/reductase SDR n=1 Tax=Rhodopseudomonas palustris (strain BisB18) TaxID=316056 RepID=Q20XY7_RHOPB
MRSVSGSSTSQLHHPGSAEFGHPGSAELQHPGATELRHPGAPPAAGIGACPFHNDQRDSRSGKQKTLVLTGASRGIGHATGKLFSEAGWRIVTCSRQPFNDERCPWATGVEDHVEIELGDYRALPRAIAALKERLGGAPLHALINNAAISPKGLEGERLTSLNTPVETWMGVFHVNLLAPILLAQGLFDELRAGSGSIVNVTSIVGSRVHPFAGTAYATSKAALACLTREMAHDYAPYGIRVNAIAPGEIKTDILSPETEARLAPTIPMRRIGTPDEVAKVMFFLCSDAASYVTGEEIHINGGQHV